MPIVPQHQNPEPEGDLPQAQPLLPAPRQEPRPSAAEARAHRVIDRSARAVWREVGDFPALADWHPGIASSTAHLGDQRVRDLVTTEGIRLTEALQAFDDTLMNLEYTFVTHPFPLTGYRARLEVRPEGDTRCAVTWTATFRPLGADGAELAARFEEGVFAPGLEALGRGEGTTSG
ncbi:SRPBCC family protein [Streptomyces sp. BBFR102]|uniref:SRPBCC family protein n=1 Tax=Streptomyces sp. BBFR102 TaxID=3448171 RepID=UPI003F534B6F